MPELTPETLQHLLVMLPIVLLSVTVHEFAHCWADDRLGDNTARNQGRLTLNPAAHLEPAGTIMIVLSSLFGYGIGWGRAAEFNPYNFRNPALGRMIGAAAGPASNILQMLLWASLGGLLPTALSDQYPILSQIWVTGVMVNIGLAAFNLLPIYPLDGHHILSFFLPPRYRDFFDHPAWGTVFLVIIFVPPLRDAILIPILTPAYAVGGWAAMLIAY